MNHKTQLNPAAHGKLLVEQTGQSGFFAQPTALVCDRFNVGSVE